MWPDLQIIVVNNNPGDTTDISLALTANSFVLTGAGFPNNPQVSIYGYTNGIQHGIGANVIIQYSSATVITGTFDYSPTHGTSIQQNALLSFRVASTSGLSVYDERAVEATLPFPTAAPSPPDRNPVNSPSPTTAPNH